MTLDARSVRKLEGVHPDLVRLVTAAAEGASFVVTEGLRTAEKQAALAKAGASQTLRSRHLTGHAVDLAALVEGEVRWDWPLFHRLAHVVQMAAEKLVPRIPVEWGAVWDRELRDLKWDGEDFQEDIDAYSARIRARGKKPFLDGPHFQLPRTLYPDPPNTPSA